MSWKSALIAVVLALVLLIAWGTLVEPYRVDRESITAELEGLPPAWDGASVALIADFQVGMWLDNTATVREVVDETIRAAPDLVLIAGDFVYHPVGEREPDELREEVESRGAVRALAELDQVLEPMRELVEAEVPVYAVLGNHDYGMNTRSDARLGWLADGVRRSLEQAGIRVLTNESTRLRSASGAQGTLYLAGIGSRYADNADPARALADIPADAPRLVLMHNPDVFPDLAPGSAPLALAGHTHGGQIRLPFTPDWSWMALVSRDRIHADGWVDGAGGNRLYVNRGIGFSMIPVRINATPELTLLRLEAAP